MANIDVSTDADVSKKRKAATTVLYCPKCGAKRFNKHIKGPDYDPWCVNEHHILYANFIQREFQEDEVIPEVIAINVDVYCATLKNQRIAKLQKELQAKRDQMDKLRHTIKAKEEILQMLTKSIAREQNPN